jgi:hypothetical protein
LEIIGPVYIARVDCHRQRVKMMIELPSGINQLLPEFADFSAYQMSTIRDDGSVWIRLSSQQHPAAFVNRFGEYVDSEEVEFA